MSNYTSIINCKELCLTKPVSRLYVPCKWLKKESQSTIRPYVTHNHHDLLCAYYVPGPVLNDLHEFSHFILMKTL